MDRYGQIQNATLFYSKDDGKSYENMSMKLINGTLSNDTYMGLLPKTPIVDDRILFKLYFQDDLGYSNFVDSNNSNNSNRDPSQTRYVTDISQRLVRIHIPHSIGVFSPNVFMTGPGGYTVKNNMIVAESMSFPLNLMFLFR